MKTMMNTVKGFLALLMILPLGFTALAQDGGNVKQDRTVEDFNAILMDQPCKMILSQGDANAVAVEGPKEIADAVKVVVKEGVLSVESEKGVEDIVIRVTAKNLKSIEVSGAANIENASPWKGEKLKLEAEGAGEVDLQLDVTELETEVSGAADVKLSGYAQKHTGEVSGAATLKAGELKTNITNIEVSGAADAKVNATEQISGEVSGAASLRNLSDAKDTKIEKSGAGSFCTDTTKVALGDREITLEGEFPPKHGHMGDKHKNPDKVSPQWMGLELGFNGYMNKDFGFEITGGNGFFEPKAGRSMNIGLNVFEWGIPLVKKHMTLVTGLGFEFNNYYYKNNFTLVPDTSAFLATNVPGDKFDVNKLAVSWVRIPLLLQFDSGKDKHGSTFHFSMGVIGALRMCSNIKQTWEIDDTRYRTLTRDDFNLSPFKADATVRIGYGYLNLFVNYSLNSMFRKNVGPELFPVSAGITLVNI